MLGSDCYLAAVKQARGLEGTVPLGVMQDHDLVTAIDHWTTFGARLYIIVICLRRWYSLYDTNKINF